MCVHVLVYVRAMFEDATQAQISMNLGRNWVASVAVVIIASIYACEYVCVCIYL